MHQWRQSFAQWANINSTLDRYNAITVRQVPIKSTSEALRVIFANLGMLVQMLLNHLCHANLVSIRRILVQLLAIPVLRVTTMSTTILTIVTCANLVTCARRLMNHQFSVLRISIKICTIK